MPAIPPGVRAFIGPARRSNRTLSRLMKSDIWYPHYIGDYQRDTQHLTTLEHGAYRLLLDTCYTSNGRLPDDDGDLSRIAKLSLSDWQAIRSRIAVFFQKHPSDNGTAGFWTHKRVLAELEKSRKQYERKSLGASKTNEKRWGTPSHSDSLSDTHSGSQCVSPSQPQSQSSVCVNRVPVEISLPPGFPVTLEDAIAGGSMVGVSQELIKKTWEKAKYRGGRDSHGQQILSWATYLSACKTYDQDRQAKEKERKSRPSRTTPRSVFDERGDG